MVKVFTKMVIPKPLALIKYCFAIFNMFILSYTLKIFRSAWNSNKFIRGSYTYIKTKSSKEDMKNLATPIVIPFLLNK